MSLLFPPVVPGHVFSGGPYVMGILNVTPDSFSDGGRFTDPEKAVQHALRMIDEGADIIDIGGESTRPGAEPVDVRTEMARVVPVIEALRGKAKWISIDTRHASVMEAALDAGATIINDISGLGDDPRSLAVAAEAKVPIILMHKQGTPKSMQEQPLYNNVIDDIYLYFRQRISSCETVRVDEKMLVLDPGVGFGKMLEHNQLIIGSIRKFSDFSLPLLVGLSRKKFIENICGGVPVEERLPGSIASALWCLSQGVRIFRVHDVKETVQALQVYAAVSSSG